MKTRDQIKKFMEPRSVALIGISSRVGKGAFNILENLARMGFPGRVFPVNPNLRELLGRKVYPEVRAIPDPVDLAVIMTPRHTVLNVLEQCVEKGIPSVLIITQGFAEADEEGRVLQSRIDQTIQKTGVRILGPNSIGVVNHFASFTTSFIPMEKKESPIALISQSGGFIGGFPQFELGKGIDLGNASDVDFADALDYFEDDPEIEVIGLYIESIQKGRMFLEAAKRVAKKKLVLALKAGRSREGARAARSHSGSLAGEDQVYEAAFRQSGLIRVRDVEELADISRAYLTLPSLSGNRIGVITPTGAGGIVILDELEESGLRLARFSEDWMPRMKSFLLPWQEVTNPMDIMAGAIAHGYKRLYTEALEALLKDDQVDLVFCVLGEPTLKTVKEVSHRYPGKPVISWVIGPSFEFARGPEFPLSYTSPRRAIRALSALLDHQDFLERETEEPLRYPVDRDSVRALLTQAKQEGRKRLGVETFSLLKAYGIPVAPFRFVTNQEEAHRAAADLGYPVALKISSPEVVHKTTVKGVRLGIRDAKELDLQYEDMIREVTQKVPKARIDGVLIQPMVTEGKEILLGAKRDAQFGPVILFGWGGIHTELWKDISFGLLPLSSQEIDRMISSTHVSRLLRETRGEASSDGSFIKECILRLAQLVSDFPEIVELDMNPLKLFAKGGLAIDARAILE